MTNITIKKDKDENIRAFKIEGHAGYGFSGSDIVCAAISALSQSALMGITNIVDAEVEIKLECGYIECIVYEKDEAKLSQCKLLLDTMELAMKDIAEQFSNYVKIGYLQIY